METISHTGEPDTLATLRETAKRLPQALRGHVEALARIIGELQEALTRGTPSGGHGRETTPEAPKE